MYVISLVGSIFAFVCSFVPLFGIPFSLISSIIAIILSVLILKRENVKEKKDASIIALVISIVAIIICIVVNVLSANFIFSAVKNIFNIDNVNYNEYYEEKFKNYTEYSLEDNIVIKDSLVLKIVETTNNNDEYCIRLNIQALEDNTYFSIYNFGLYNSSINEFIYPSSSVLDNDFLSGNLNEGDEKNILLKYTPPSVNEENMYLIFVDNDNGVKVSL